MKCPYCGENRGPFKQCKCQREITELTTVREDEPKPKPRKKKKPPKPPKRKDVIERKKRERQEKFEAERQRIADRRLSEQEILKPIPKVDIKDTDGETRNSEVSRLVSQVSDNQTLSLSSDQEYRSKDSGNWIINHSNIMGQDYVKVIGRSDIGMFDIVDDGTLTDNQKKRTVPPSVPPTIPPIVPPPVTPPPINPVDPPNNPYPPVGPVPPEIIPPEEEEEEEPNPCLDATPVTVTTSSTTATASDVIDITITGGVGPYTITIEDPLDNIASSDADSITIKSSVSNPECSGNITVTVEDLCGSSSSTTIGVTAGYETSIAYRAMDGTYFESRSLSICNCVRYYDAYECNGDRWGDSSYECALSECNRDCVEPESWAAAWAAACACSLSSCPNPIDVRTSVMITAGCCPGEL